MNFRFSGKKGNSIKTIEEMSDSRNEPDWLREFRWRSYDTFVSKSVSNSICDPIETDFRNTDYHNACFWKRR
jgi:Fe-S cluster assembly protein SufB